MRATPSANSFRPAVQRLEAREVPASSSVGRGLYDGQTLYIEGTAWSDWVGVYQDRGQNLTSVTDDKIWVISNINNGDYKYESFSLNSGYSQFSDGRLPINRVIFHGYGLNDTFNNFTSFSWQANWGPTLDLPTFAYGGEGNDTLMGANAQDALYGEGGDDKLYGNDGVDTLIGGNGWDELHGGNGGDWLDGGAGDLCWDKLYGEGGNDVFVRDYLWYRSPSGTWFSFNPDSPQDFNAGQGDRMVG